MLPLDRGYGIVSTHHLEGWTHELLKTPPALLEGETIVPLLFKGTSNTLLRDFTGPAWLILAEGSLSFFDPTYHEMFLEVETSYISGFEIDVGSFSFEIGEDGGEATGTYRCVTTTVASHKIFKCLQK